jgi:hypothetical protein
LVALTPPGRISGIRSSPEKGWKMNAIPVQEIKRRGIGAMDDLIAKGEVHVIRNNVTPACFWRGSRDKKATGFFLFPYPCRRLSWKDTINHTDST